LTAFANWISRGSSRSTRPRPISPTTPFPLGTKSRILAIPRWREGMNCSSESGTVSRYQAGTAATWHAQELKRMDRCAMVFTSGGGAQPYPCERPAVASCADCGAAICSRCQNRCCGELFCDLCWDYHMRSSCVRKPIRIQPSAPPLKRAVCLSCADGKTSQPANTSSESATQRAAFHLPSVPSRKSAHAN
jgi:hypothetical protein